MEANVKLFNVAQRGARQMANAKTKDLGHKLVHANTVFLRATRR